MSRFFPAAFVVLLAIPLAAQQQDSSTPPPQHPNSSSAQKKNGEPPRAHKPSAAEQNPFPEAQSEAAARKAQQDQDATPSAPAPQPPDQTKPESPAAARNPFPEKQSQKAAQQNEQPSSSGSGPGKDYSSSQSGLEGLDIPKTNKDARAIHDPGLGNKDTQVGMFYLKTGDYKGAYDRFIEATQIDPGNADAVFGLAESARHLGHRDEAIRNYRLYLSAVPDGRRAKAARSGLKDLGVSPNS